MGSETPADTRVARQVWINAAVTGLDELLTIWEHNTESMVESTQRDSETIVAACLGVFEGLADHRLYNANSRNRLA